jgi:FdhE protein
MEFNLDEAGRKLEKKITQLKGKSYISDELINLLDTVAHLQLTARDTAKVTLPADSDMAPPEAIIQGMPLVTRANFPYDKTQAKKLLGAIISQLKKMGGPLGKAAGIVEKAMDSGEFTPNELFESFMEDDNTFFNPWVERTPDAPKTLVFLAFAALAPSIETAAEELSEKLPDMKAPQVGTCPICGSLPLISSLREKEGFRHATCSFCRHEYRIKRIACPVCGEEDQKKLTFFTVEEEPGFRVDVCDSCKTYIKTIDFRALDRIAMPVLDDLDSLALDYVAAGQGYKRATLSAWGF